MGKHRPAVEGRKSGSNGRRPVTEPLEQLLELSAAAVNVADDVERAALVPLVGPERRPLEGGGLDLLGAFEEEDVAEAFASEVAERLAELRVLVAHDARAEVAVGPPTVALLADLLGQ